MYYEQIRVSLKFKWIPEIKMYFKSLDVPKKSERCKVELSRNLLSIILLTLCIVYDVPFIFLHLNIGSRIRNESVRK